MRKTNNKKGDVFCGSCKYFEPAYIHDQVVYDVGSCKIKTKTYIDAICKEVVNLSCYEANRDNNCTLYKQKSSFLGW